MGNGSSRPRIALRRGVPRSRAFQKPEEGLCSRCPAHSEGPILRRNYKGLGQLGQNGPPSSPARTLAAREAARVGGRMEPALTIWLGAKGESLSWSANYLPRPGSRRI